MKPEELKKIAVSTWQPRLNEIKDALKKAAKNGEFSVTFDELHENVIMLLEEENFNVSYGARGEWVVSFYS